MEEEPARGNLCRTVPTAHTCQIFAHSSKINHSKHVELGQPKSLPQDLISKNHKSKREAHFIDLSLTLSLLTSDSRPKNRSSSRGCSDLNTPGDGASRGNTNKQQNALWALEHPPPCLSQKHLQQMLTGRKLGGNPKKSSRRRYRRNTLSISKFF